MTTTTGSHVPVTVVSTFPVTAEFLVDAGLDHDGSAAKLLAERWAESRRRWAALPWRVRVYRRLQLPEVRGRIVLAWEALRGRHECDE